VDAFYKFTVPKSGKVRFKADMFNFLFVHFAIYDACNGKELFCFPNQNVVSDYPEVELPPGETVILQIFQSEKKEDEKISFCIEEAR